MRLSEIESRLGLAGISDARREARLILSRIGGLPDYKLLFDCECTDEAVISAVKRRCERVPLAYIIGEADFYKESYKVTEDCLIPRPETELLVDYAVRNLRAGANFLDLCTGSGCVAISTLKNTEGTRATALDLSPSALAVAKENAERNGVSDRVEFVLADVLTAVPEGRFFALLSNPPYVSEAAYRTLEPEIYSEPKIAFLGGEDGGDFYRRLIPIYKNSIEKDGFLAFEIGFDQRDLLLQLAKENGMAAEIIKDYSGNDRIAVLKHI